MTFQTKKSIFIVNFKKMGTFVTKVIIYKKKK